MNRNDIVFLQDELVSALIGLAKACTSHVKTENTDQLLVDGLFVSMPSENQSEKSLQEMIDQIHDEKMNVAPDCSKCLNPCGNSDDYPMENIMQAEPKIKGLKLLILMTLRGIATYMHNQMSLSADDEQIYALIHKGLCVLSYDLAEERYKILLSELSEIL